MVHAMEPCIHRAFKANERQKPFVAMKSADLFYPVQKRSAAGDIRGGAGVGSLFENPPIFVRPNRGLGRGSKHFVKWNDAEKYRLER